MSGRGTRDTDPEIEVGELTDQVEITQEYDTETGAPSEHDAREHDASPDAPDSEEQRLARTEAGRRARERAAYEEAFDAMVTRADEAAGPLTPAERVRFGLGQVKRGLVEGRAELERLDYERDLARTALVHGEASLRVLSTEARAARIPRFKRAHEREGARRPMGDARPAPMVHTPIDDETRASLVQMALVPRPLVEAPEEPKPPALTRLLNWVKYSSPEPTRGSRLAEVARQQVHDADQRTRVKTG